MAKLQQYRQDAQQVYEFAEAALGVASEQRFAFRMGQAMVLRGWALVMLAQGETGLEQIHQGLDAIQITGAKVEQSYRLGLLGEAYGHIGQPDMGLQVLAEALALSHTSGEHRGEAELYRLKGELLLVQRGKGRNEKEEAAAEACFQQALAIARRQSAKALELRTAMSLARLWQQQGKRAEAYDLLAPVYGWFTEGFDTLDLQEAKALLER